MNNTHVYSSRSTRPGGGKKNAKSFDSVRRYNIYTLSKKNVFQNTEINRWYLKKKCSRKLLKTDECYAHRDLTIVGHYTIFYEAMIFTYPAKFCSKIVFWKQYNLFKTIEYKSSRIALDNHKTMARDRQLLRGKKKKKFKRNLALEKNIRITWFTICFT